MSIYTGRGDSGETCGGEKCECNIESIGKIDELLASMDFSLVTKLDLSDRFNIIKNKLAGICSNLALNKSEVNINENDVKLVENWINELPRVSSFVNFKTEQATRVNECRVRNRALERALVKFSKEKQIDSKILAYINRLSDYFFVLAASLN